MQADIVAFTVWSMVHGIVSLEIRNRCSVVESLNQKDLARKASEMVNEILERMHKNVQ